MKGGQAGWEWETLFDVPVGNEEESLWVTVPTSVRVGRMGYRTRTIRSGDIVEAEIYPVFGRNQEGICRRAREQVSPERMERANQAAAIRRVIRLANCNFTERDIHLTLTYGTKPPSFEQAQKDVRNFLRRVKRIREKRGLPDVKYIYVIEDEEHGEKKRIHAHMLISGGLTREELEACWRRGWANADRLQPNEEGLAAIARYITKAQRNRKKWVSSRNLKKPKVRVSDTKLNARRVEKLARQLDGEWQEVLRKVYPGMEPVNCEVWASDIVTGLFIRATLNARRGRLKEGGPR